MCFTARPKSPLFFRRWIVEFNGKRFGKWVKAERTKRGISCYLLGPQIGMHPTSLGKIEAGALDVRMSTFLAICNGFNRSPAKVLAEMVDAL